MKVTKSNQIYQLAFLPTLFPVNCYLIEESEYLTLIDAALPSSYMKILQTAEKIGKPIKQIILTHAHSDHIGSLDKLKELLPHVQVSISKRDARLLKGDKGLLQGKKIRPFEAVYQHRFKRHQISCLWKATKLVPCLLLKLQGIHPALSVFSILDQMQSS